MKRNAESDRRAPWEHLQETSWASCLLVRSPGHWHDWNLQRDTWHVTPGCLPAARHVSVWLEHYGVSITPGHRPPRPFLEPETAGTYYKLSVGVLGKKEKYVLICCSICISTFAVNFGLDFDKWVSPANRELCVFCKIRLMGDWRTEIGSRLTQEQRTPRIQHNSESERSVRDIPICF